MFAYLITGLLVGGLAGFLLARSTLMADNARLAAEKDAALDKLRQQDSNVEALQQQFGLQFENLANRIFDEKNDKFKKESQENIGNLLNPLRERLQEFQKKVDESFGQQAKEQFSLKREIENILQANEKMTIQTESLTRALKGDVKAQGNWGEIALERILEDSGLVRDRDYVLQGAGLGLKNLEGGQTQKPDVIINLPEGKHIIIDAKVSLTHYERHIAAGDDADRALALKQYLASIYSHVDGLADRRYQDNDKLGTPDFVLMFMPIEGAYSLAVQHDAALHGYAWHKRIAIVSPATLFATMKTIASVWRIEHQNKNAVEIARQGGNLYDKIAGFIDMMQDLGAKISASQKIYDKAFENLTSGPGNILRRTESLKELGIKASKKMPAGLIAEDVTGDDIKKVENG